MSTPIYHSTCEDLKVYPQAMKQRSHRQFMQDADQHGWLEGAYARMNSWSPPRQFRTVQPRKRSSPRRGS